MVAAAFTFYYIYINTANVPTPVGDITNLHSTIFILIPAIYMDNINNACRNLHSTIFILIQVHSRVSHINTFMSYFCRPIKILPYISIFCHIFFKKHSNAKFFIVCRSTMLFALLEVDR